MDVCGRCGTSNDIIDEFQGEPICLWCWQKLAEEAALLEMRILANKEKIERLQKKLETIK